MSVKDREYEKGIANRLRDARERLDLTQDAWKDQLKVRSGYEVSKGGVSQYERGMRVPAAYVAAVSDAFSLRVEWILWERGPMVRNMRDAEVQAYRVIAQVVRSTDEGDSPIAAALDALEVLRLAEENEDGGSGKGAA